MSEKLSVPRSARIDRRWLLFASGCVAAYSLPLIQHGRNLWSREYFQFFPLLMIGVLLLAWQRRDDLSDLAGRRWQTGFVATSLAVLTLGLSVYVRSPWVAAVSAFLLGEGLLAQAPRLRALWRVLAILIPLPLGYDAALVQYLQNLSSRGASCVLDFLQIDHLMSGNILEFAGGQLFVEEACSGISSFYLLVAVTLLYLAVQQPRLLLSLLLVLSVAWWSVISNVFRISSIAVADVWFGTDLAHGTPHTILGCLVLGFSVAMIGSTLKLLQGLLAPIDGGSGLTDNDPGRRRMTPLILWNLLTVADRSLLPGRKSNPAFSFRFRRSRLLGTLSVLLLAAPLGSLLMSASGDLHHKESGPPTNRSFNALPEDLFAETGGNLSALSFESIEREDRATRDLFGGYSRKWQLQHDERQVTVSVDGPFYDWHDLRICYTSGGWRMLETVFQDHIARVEMANDLQEHQSLYFAIFRNSTELVPVPREISSASMMEAVTSRLGRRRDSASANHPVWQVQLVVTRPAAPLAAESAADLQLFQQCLKRVQQHWEQNQ